MGILKNYIFFICFCSLLLSGCSAPGSTETESLKIMTYNVENLFDDIYDGTEYSDYNPDRGKWTYHDFHAKLKNISRVIKTSCKNGPDIIALQEIENLNTLKTLLHEYLCGMGYGYYVIPQAPGSAVNTAIISRCPLRKTRVHAVTSPHPLRYILETEIEYNSRRIRIFNNHWKSKYGGAENTEILRLESASLVLKRLNTLLNEDPDMDILILGDFNENVNEYFLQHGKYQTAFIQSNDIYPETYLRKSFLIPGIDEPPDGSGKTILFTIWEYLENQGEKGSYVFRGKWETIDNIFFSKGLLDKSGVFFKKVELVKREFMLDRRGNPMGWMKNIRMGYSDHLPLLIEISFS